ncbi:MAG: hypothetical protein AB2L16_03710 [Anaerolineaceae bacterium]
MNTSVWPADYFKESHVLDRKHANHLIVFLASPFSPKDRYDELYNYCQDVCATVGRSLAAEVECVRADSLSTPDVIHQDIWKHIQMSDAIIADVSEKNGNVLFELGVASATRDKDSITIIQDNESEGGFLFDISPARHLMYKRGLYGSLDFQKKLIHSLIYSLAPAPYVPHLYLPATPPLDLDLTQPNNDELLLSPGNSYRQLTKDGLLFGSFYSFRYSWLSIGKEDFDKVKVQTEMKFANHEPTLSLNDAWIGINLRSQHFLSDFGHLIYVTNKGNVLYTQPKNEFEKEPNDPQLGQIKDFTEDKWVNFSLIFDEFSLSGYVNDVKIDLPVSKMPYKYNAGLLRFQTYRARACIRKISFEIPN